MFLECCRPSSPRQFKVVRGDYRGYCSSLGSSRSRRSRRSRCYRARSRLLVSVVWLIAPPTEATKETIFHLGPGCRLYGVTTVHYTIVQCYSTLHYTTQELPAPGYMRSLSVLKPSNSFLRRHRMCHKPRLPVSQPACYPALKTT